MNLMVSFRALLNVDILGLGKVNYS